MKNQDIECPPVVSIFYIDTGPGKQLKRLKLQAAVLKFF
jgi:hypothetical protein